MDILVKARLKGSVGKHAKWVVRFLTLGTGEILAYANTAMEAMVKAKRLAKKGIPYLMQTRFAPSTLVIKHKFSQKKHIDPLVAAAQQVQYTEEGEVKQGGATTYTQQPGVQLVSAGKPMTLKTKEGMQTILVHEPTTGAHKVVAGVKEVEAYPVEAYKILAGKKHGVTALPAGIAAVEEDQASTIRHLVGVKGTGKASGLTKVATLPKDFDPENPVTSTMSLGLWPAVFGVEKDQTIGGIIGKQTQQYATVNKLDKISNAALHKEFEGWLVGLVRGQWPNKSRGLMGTYSALQPVPLPGKPGSFSPMTEAKYGTKAKITEHKDWSIYEGFMQTARARMLELAKVYDPKQHGKHFDRYIMGVLGAELRKEALDLQKEASAKVGLDFEDPESLDNYSRGSYIDPEDMYALAEGGLEEADQPVPMLYGKLGDILYRRLTPLERLVVLAKLDLYSEKSSLRVTTYDPVKDLGVHPFLISSFIIEPGSVAHAVTKEGKSYVAWSTPGAQMEGGMPTTQIAKLATEMLGPEAGKEAQKRAGNIFTQAFTKLEKIPPSERSILHAALSQHAKMSRGDKFYPGPSPVPTASVPKGFDAAKAETEHAAAMKEMRKLNYGYAHLEGETDKLRTSLEIKRQKLIDKHAKGADPATLDPDARKALHEKVMAALKKLDQYKDLGSKNTKLKNMGTKIKALSDTLYDLRSHINEHRAFGVQQQETTRPEMWELAGKLKHATARRNELMALGAAPLAAGVATAAHPLHEEWAKVSQEIKDLRFKLHAMSAPSAGASTALGTKVTAQMKLEAMKQAAAAAGGKMKKALVVQKHATAQDIRDVMAEVVAAVGVARWRRRGRVAKALGFSGVPYGPDFYGTGNRPETVTYPENKDGGRGSGFWVGKKKKRTVPAGELDPAVSVNEKESFSGQTEKRPESILTKAHSGTMVALRVPEATAKKLKSKEDVPHVTLVYVKGLDADQINDLVLIVGSMANRAAPIEGVFGGIGRFLASPSSDGKDVIYASLDAPALPSFRDKLIREMRSSLLFRDEDQVHGYSPHATIEYVETGGSCLHKFKRVPVVFDTIEVHSGGNVYSYKLKGQEIFVKALSPATLALIAKKKGQTGEAGKPYGHTEYTKQMPSGTLVHVKAKGVKPVEPMPPQKPGWTPEAEGSLKTGILQAVLAAKAAFGVKEPPMTMQHDPAFDPVHIEKFADTLKVVKEAGVFDFMGADGGLKVSLEEKIIGDDGEPLAAYACYKPSTVSIHVRHTTGNYWNSFAHEFWHYLDNKVGKARAKAHAYVSSFSPSGGDPVLGKMASDFLQALLASKGHAESLKQAVKQFHGKPFKVAKAHVAYLTSPTEMMARFFNEWFIDRVHRTGTKMPVMLAYKPWKEQEPPEWINEPNFKELGAKLEALLDHVGVKWRGDPKPIPEKAEVEFASLFPTVPLPPKNPNAPKTEPGPVHGTDSTDMASVIEALIAGLGGPKKPPAPKFEGPMTDEKYQQHYEQTKPSNAWGWAKLLAESTGKPQAEMLKEAKARWPKLQKAEIVVLKALPFEASSVIRKEPHGDYLLSHNGVGKPPTKVALHYREKGSSTWKHGHLGTFKPAEMDKLKTAMNEHHAKQAGVVKAIGTKKRDESGAPEKPRRPPKPAKASEKKTNPKTGKVQYAYPKAKQGGGQQASHMPSAPIKLPEVDVEALANRLRTTSGALREFAQQFKTPEEFAHHFTSNFPKLVSKHGITPVRLHKLHEALA